MNSDDVDLPGVITAVTSQKRRHGRCSVFVDDQFLIGVDNDVVLKNDLHKGVEITPVLFRKIQNDEGRQAVKSYLLKLLSRRDHARLELFQKASRKDFNIDVVNLLLDELKGKGYIDDGKFAQKFANDKYHLNDWGPRKIKASLRQKGVKGQTAERAISNTFEKTDLGEQFKKLIKKRKKHFAREENPLKRKKKITDYLQRKGYYGSDVFRDIDSLMTIFEASEEREHFV